MSQSGRNPVPGPEQKAPFQFTLAQLFLVTTIFAAGCGIVATLGLGVVIVIVIGMLVVSAAAALLSRIGTTAAAVLTGLMLIGFLIAMLLPDIDGPSSSRRSMCQNNLHQIYLALLTYEQEHGCLPPVYIADESGKPMHSWRVLILPYLEYQPLYEAYDFDEPWDGPHNRKLAETFMPVFACPADRNDSSATTSYVAVVGPGTAWPDGKSSKLEDLNDGPQNTILLVEVANSGIHWMEPRDLNVLQMAPRINPKTGQGISSNHPGVVNVLMADGSVRSLPDDLPPETLRALLSPNGGEKIDLEELCE